MIARDPAEIKKHHEVLWNAIVDKIESLTAAGKTDIARVVPLVAEDERRETGDLDEMIAKIFSVPKDENGVPTRTLVAVDGKYRFVPPNFVKETLLATVLANLTEETEVVVELGSGWGRNLFNVYLRCRRKDLRFVACEPADAGRRATELLCALEDGIPFAGFFVPGGDDDVVFHRPANRGGIEFDSRNGQGCAGSAEGQHTCHGPEQGGRENLLRLHHGSPLPWVIQLQLSGAA